MKPIYTCTADEIMEKNPEIAIIPVGSLEQHGHHLPIMTDWAIATELGHRVSERLGAFQIPALPISTNREQMGKKGTVWMEPMTFYQMMTDIIMSLKTQGFKKIGIIQCHGGIFVMTPLVRDLNARNNPDLMVALADTCTLGSRITDVLETTNNLHAGESETSMMLALHPETVHMDKAVDCSPSTPRPWLSYGSIFRYCPDGVWGHATKGTKEKGEKWLSEMTDIMVDEFKAAFDMMENKKKFNYSNF